jgi:hypothetical protein
MSQDRKCNRRRFLGMAAMSIVGAELGMIGSANAQSTKAKPAEALNVKPGTNTSFASLKQIEAGVLNVGYAEAGPATGPAVAARRIQIAAPIAGINTN